MSSYCFIYSWVVAKEVFFGAGGEFMKFLCGGFKYFLFSPLLGEDFHQLEFCKI